MGGYTGEYYPATAPSQMRSAHSRQLAAVGVGVSGVHFATWKYLKYKTFSGPGVRPSLLDHPLQARWAFRGPLRCQQPLPEQRATFDLISHKVSQNGIVSPKSSEKACHSPCFQNLVQKSPLEILGFPVWLAFSRKELMGHFDARTDFIVKMTKCRQCVPALTSVYDPFY